MQALDTLLTAVKLQANVFHNGQYCGAWALDTSGTQRMTFHVVAVGQCSVWVENQQFTMHEGDAVFFPSDAKHRISAFNDIDTPINSIASRSMIEPYQADSTGLICGDFGHDNPIFKQLLKQLPIFIHVSFAEQASSNHIINLMIAESRQLQSSSSLLLDRLADCLLYTLLRDNVDTQHGLFAAMVHPQLNKAMELIHQSDGQIPKLDDLARASAMSRSSFSEIFKTLVGESPGDYAIKWRMTRAYRWLADEKMSTLEAAIRSGYENEASFSKAFKRVIGVGPGSVRAQP